MFPFLTLMLSGFDASISRSGINSSQVYTMKTKTDAFQEVFLPSTSSFRSDLFTSSILSPQWFILRDFPLIHCIVGTFCFDNLLTYPANVKKSLSILRVMYRCAPKESSCDKNLPNSG
ncbi:hypothetical protein ILYODFUR_017002 [Ilyodon furcidens]|uniref:Uncharacterized protein n=1 Tax=Ilyodon furcidens TaxID=33524 RepID=A0ABV0USV0_9TELE